MEERHGGFLTSSQKLAFLSATIQRDSVMLVVGAGVGELSVSGRAPGKGDRP